MLILEMKDMSKLKEIIRMAKVEMTWFDFLHLVGLHHKVDLFTVRTHLAPEVHA